MSENRQVITRMAPSPTGLFHVGSLRTTIFNYLFARKLGGKFILRIEDTDKERSKKEYEDNILESLTWLGLEYDEFYRQSERTATYKIALERLIASGNAYLAEENQSGTGNVIRFKNSNEKIKFSDIILGDIEFDTTELGNFVIARDMENPVYHLTVVVDDGEMNVSHVIRGQDHISNTPRQILLLEALGYARPLYAHIPLILSADKSKMSKRKGDVAVTQYKEQGYTTDALINFMALLGWNPGNDLEIFSKDELIQLFDLEKVQRGGAVFNPEKLDWINKEWLNKMSPAEFTEYLGSLYTELASSINKEATDHFIQVIRERINKRQDLVDMIAQGEFNYLGDTPTYPPESLIWKKSNKEATRSHVAEIQTRLSGISDWNIDNIKNSLWDYAEAKGKGDVLWPMRYALSGQEKSPDPFTLAFILGKEKTLERITSAKQALS